MEQISTVRALVALWPSRQVFAEDVDVPLARVHKWVGANSIPNRFHRQIITAGQSRDFPVTADILIDIHAPSEDAA